MARNVFISGTNSGIGRLSALKLAYNGHRVFATMRNTTSGNAQAAVDLVAQAKNWTGSIQVFDMDVADDESVRSGVEQALTAAGHFDAVVSCTGFAMMGLQETLSDDELMYQLDVNLIGPHRLLRAVLPSLRSRKAGLLIHLTGTLGRLVLPAMGAFCASKAALEALVDAYAYELAPLGIDSTIVQLGLFPTGFADRIEVGEDHERAAAYGSNARLSDTLGATISKMIAPPNAADPDEAATAIAILVNTGQGKRPNRVVIDPINGALVTSVNAAHQDSQEAFLRAMGMEDLI